MSDADSRRITSEQFPGLQSEPAIEFELSGEAQTRLLGRWLAAEAEAGDFIGLIGGLGAGKTTLVQGLVSGRDESGRWKATSPTYALVQVYETTPPIYHMDLYRLEGWGDLESIGYWDYLEGGRGIACVEWLDRIPGAWPEKGIIIELVGSGEGRKIKMWTDAAWAQKASTLNAAVLESISKEE